MQRHPVQPTTLISWASDPDDAERLANAVREICGIAAGDARDFDPSSIQIEEIREEARELVAKRAALLPPPRCHTARYQDVLGPCARNRAACSHLMKPSATRLTLCSATAPGSGTTKPVR